MKISPPSGSSPHRALESFRPNPKRSLRLHPAESVLLWIVGAHLIFLPWALGSMRPWAQFIGFGFAVVGFIVALLPRNYTEDLTGGPRFRLYTTSKLFRFPFFWLGLLYFAVIGVQIANPAWNYMLSTAGWWVEPVAHVSWLPHGVGGAPFAKMNAWRTLMIHGGVWLAVCALWIGITRRRSAQLLLVAIAINGVALAVVAILQRLTESDRLLFFWPRPSIYFVASFVYKNHAGAYLNIILALCLGLAWWHAHRAEQRMAKSHPGLLFLFFAIFVGVALLFTYALAATALGAAFVLTVAIGYVIQRFSRSRHDGSSRGATLLTAGLCAVFLGLCAYSLNIEKVTRKFGRVADEEYTSSITYRQLATKATFDMGRDELWLGHGLGGYRYVFPRFQQEYPEIFTSRKRRLYWEHAHNDYVEFFAESGVLGLGLLALGSVFVIVGLRRAGVFSQPSGLIVAGGPFLVAVYAAADFPTHNPAVLTTACAVLVLTIRWVGLDRSKHARTGQTLKT